MAGFPLMVVRPSEFLPHMKKYLAPLLSLAVLAFLAGCETSGVSTRIQEKSVVFNSLMAWQQKDIQEGIVDLGFSTDMVYMALGKPSKVVTSANGQETIWTYANYYPPSTQPHAQAANSNPGGANYTSGVESASSPRSGKSLSDTNPKGYSSTSLDVPDMPSDTLYVTFREGQVTATRFESDSK